MIIELRKRKDLDKKLCFLRFLFRILWLVDYESKLSFVENLNVVFKIFR